MIILLVALLLTAPLNTLADSPEQAGELLNSRAPELEISTSGGQAIPGDTFTGKPRLVAFLALNVQQGANLLKSLNTLSKNPSLSEVEIIAIDMAGKTNKMKKLSQGGKLGFMLVTGDSKQFMVDWRIQFLPTVFFIDSDNTIRAILTGTTLSSADNIYKAVATNLQ